MVEGQTNQNQRQKLSLTKLSSTPIVSTTTQNYDQEPQSGYLPFKKRGLLGKKRNHSPQSSSEEPDDQHSDGNHQQDISNGNQHQQDDKLDTYNTVLSRSSPSGDTKLLNLVNNFSKQKSEMADTNDKETRQLAVEAQTTDNPLMSSKRSSIGCGISNSSSFNGTRACEELYQRAIKTKLFANWQSPEQSNLIGSASSPLLIEGPEFDNDYSYHLVEACQEIKELERGVSLMGVDSPDKLFENCDPGVEHRVLMRINCYIKHYENLYHSLHQNFKEKNRYPDILPFQHNRVIIKPEMMGSLNNLIQEFTEDNKVVQSSEQNGNNSQFLAYMDQDQQTVANTTSTQVKKVDNKESSDRKDNFQNYINASYINTSITKKVFIAACAPVNKTIKSFQKMIVQNNIKLVIQLCDFNEDNKDKCAFYTGFKDQLDKDENNVILKDSEHGIIKQTKKKTQKGLITRKLHVTLYKTQDDQEASEDKEKEILAEYQFTHIQDSVWQDDQSPASLSNNNTSSSESISKEQLEAQASKNAYERISHMIVKIDKYRKKYPDSPVLVHCSAGCGRTGTLIALYSLVETLNKFKQLMPIKPESVNEPDLFYQQVKYPRLSVFGCVRRLREQRWNLVKNEKQYTYIYQFIRQWIQENKCLF